MDISTVKISRDRPVEGLYQLLAATESLGPDRIARESAIDNLNDRVAEPLRGIIEQALEWVAEIETVITTNTNLPVPERRSVAEACFSSQRDLRRALRELGLSDCTIDEAIARCKTAANRVRSSLTAMVRSMGERDCEPTLEWGAADHSRAKTMERSTAARRAAAPTTRGKGPRFARFRDTGEQKDAEPAIRPRRLAAGTGSPQFRRVPPPPQHRPLVANAVIADRKPQLTTEIVEPPPVPSLAAPSLAPPPPLPSLAVPNEPLSQPYCIRPDDSAEPIPAPARKSRGQTLLEQLSRTKRRKQARLRRRAAESRRD